MNITEIKGIVPGAGKTTVLVKNFTTTNLPNKILLCPSNKDRQVCIEKAIDFGMDPGEAEKSIKTLRKFKGNYYKHTSSEKCYDAETGKYYTKKSKPHFSTTHSKPHYGKIWNIFVDEASMVSKEEMDDLVKNWRINNLVLCGDSLQFGPIGHGDLLSMGSDIVDKWDDEGDFYDLPIDKQFLLNKSLRSIDPKLTKAINLVKEGKAIEAINLLHRDKDLSNSRCKYEGTDWHIAFTNKACENINKKYENPNRFIITLPDHRYKFWKSEIFDLTDKRFVHLSDILIMAKAKDPDVPLFSEWLEIHTSPAYAVTGHKLQGTTIPKGKIYIHLEDVVYGLRGIVDEEKRAAILQTLLYVGISRAIEASQIEFCMFGENPLYEAIENRLHPLVKSDDGSYIPDLDSNIVGDELVYLQSKMKPLVDETIREDAIVLSGDDERVNDLLEDSLERDISTVEDVPQEYKEMISKAHSKPSKWTDEKLMSYKGDIPGLRNDLSTCDKARRERILSRFTKLTGIDVTEETEEERKERVSKAHSGEHKASKWNDERIMSYTCFEDLKKKTKNYKKPLRERILNRWLELHNIVNEEVKDVEVKTVEKVKTVSIDDDDEIADDAGIGGEDAYDDYYDDEDEFTWKPQPGKSYVDIDEEEALEQLAFETAYSEE